MSGSVITSGGEERWTYPSLRRTVYLPSLKESRSLTWRYPPWL